MYVWIHVGDITYVTFFPPSKVWERTLNESKALFNIFLCFFRNFLLCILNRTHSLGAYNKYEMFSTFSEILVFVAYILVAHRYTRVCAIKLFDFIYLFVHSVLSTKSLYIYIQAHKSSVKLQKLPIDWLKISNLPGKIYKD